MRNRREKAIYPLVARWVRRHFLCFKTAINKGLSYSRVDVIGIRDVGGDLSGDVETVAVEVKKGASPFATASGQTLGYNVYANRVYLADVRSERFTQDELRIASHLGIGLILIRDKKCLEVLSSPFYNPIPRFHLALLEHLGLGKCQLCASIFETGDIERMHANLTRENVRQAIKNEKGLVFWNDEVSERKDKLKLRGAPQHIVYDRRFICPDCIRNFISQLSAKPS